MKAETTSKLRSWREAAGYSLQEVADLSGLDTSTLSRVERGERQLLPATKVALARALSVRVAELFDVEPVEDAG